MRDWFGETQVYVRWQKAAEEQKRFDKAKTVSSLASRDHPAALYPFRHITGNPKLFRVRGSLMGSGELAAACLVSRSTGNWRTTGNEASSTRYRGRQAAGAGRHSPIVVGWLKRSKELPTLCLPAAGRRKTKSQRVGHPEPCRSVKDAPPARLLPRLPL